MTTTTREVRSVPRTVTIVSTDTLHGCTTGSIDQICYGFYCIDRTKQHTTKSPDVENTFDSTHTVTKPRNIIGHLQFGTEH